MAIAAQRFKFLDNQTNVPVADMASQQSSDLLNSAQNDLKQISSNLSNLLQTNAVTPIENVLNGTGISSFFTNLGQVRITKDFFSSGINLTATPTAILNNAAKSLSGTDTKAATALSQLAQACQNSVLGGVGARRSQNPLITCSQTGMSRPANIGGCNINKLANAISQQNGGLYTPSIFDQFNVENAASLIGMAGYKAALCGVFSALTSNMTNLDSISRIASNMLGVTATRSDIGSVIDIGTSLAKGNVTSIIPGVSSMIFSHYKTPSYVSDRQLPTIYSGLTGAMGNIDPNWATDPATGLPSTANLGGNGATNSSDINKLLLCGSSSAAVTPSTDGSVIGLNNPSILLAGNQFSQNNVSDSLMQGFNISV